MSGERLTQTEGKFPLEELVWLGKDRDSTRHFFCRMTKIPYGYDVYGGPHFLFVASPEIITLIENFCWVEEYGRVTKPCLSLIFLPNNPEHKDIETKIRRLLDGMDSLSRFSPKVN